jgi:hypothetical protein
MAQCGGAGIKKLGLADGVFGFANIESARFYKGVEYQKVFKMVIKNIKVTDRYLKQSPEFLCGTLRLSAFAVMAFGICYLVFGPFHYFYPTITT